MKLRLVAVALLVAITGMFALAPVGTAQAAPQHAVAGIPITGSGPNASFVGTFTPQSFIKQNGQLALVGNLTGTLTNTLTGVTQAINQTVTLPVANISGSCPILHLELGPLDLNLLGLQVHLNQVVLDITAQSGSGNLLGNLLCAVSHLLDSSANVNGLVNLLNQILGAL